MSDPILELRNVTKRFGTRREPIMALAGVSLSLYAGETLGIVGESGSGKSTVARIAVGLDVPTTGEAIVMTQPAKRDDPHGLTQMVFQDPASSLDPLLRVVSSVREPLDALRVDWPERRTERAERALVDVGLGSDAGSRFPTDLSGGQKQRASIARAVVARPPILICDEAVTSLDVSIRAQILNLLRRVQNENKIACIFISHDLCTVAYMSHRIAVMYLGKVVEIGTTEQLFATPAHPYTYALLSAVPALQQGAYKRPAIRLKGDPPSVMRPPSGCRFHTRCPIAVDRCRSEEPPLREFESGHQVACHFAPVNESVLALAAAGEAAAKAEGEVAA
jgi:oligopeptide/dipeptide ABC transporter ATP-binding protein